MMQTEAVPRKNLFNVRFSDEEQERLDRVCEHLGVNAANLIRMLVKEKARELGVDIPPAAPSSRPRTKAATKKQR